MQRQADSSSRPNDHISLDVLQLARTGEMYDLCSGWWPGMPLPHGHPPFQLMTYRSPRGERNQRDLPFLDDNQVNFGFISEMLLCTTHTGTHIDALAHITCGVESAWYGGHSSDTALGDFGPLTSDARQLSPIFARGVVLDLPGVLGVDALEAHHAIGRQELEQACVRQGVELRAGDVVLVRTGTMRYWPDPAAMAFCEGAGLALDGAQWLTGFAPLAIGGDTAALEVSPSGYDGDPQPVHRHVINERGIPIIEWVNCEALARDRVNDFLFVCLPLPITGATGSLVRPLAIV